MAFETDIKAFHNWATQLGFNPDIIPNDDALKAVFSSNVCDVFRQLLERVRPRQVVQDVKATIVANKMLKYKNQIIPTSEFKHLPKEMQLHLNRKKLLQKKKQLQTDIKEQKQEYDSLAECIKTGNIEYIQREQEEKPLKVRVNILELKSKALHKDIATQQQLNEKLRASMPVKLTFQNAGEARAQTAMQQAIRDLEIFYNFYVEENNNPKDLQQAKDALWMKMRGIFANIPASSIFNAIMHMQDKQLEDIIALFNENSTDVSNNDSSNAINPFKFNVMLMKADLLALIAKFGEVTRERHSLEERFANAYTQFVENLLVQFANDTTDDEVRDTIISDYLIQFNMRNFKAAQIEFFSHQIERIKEVISSKTVMLENHELLLASTRTLYEDINSAVSRINYEVFQLGQIKDKIMHSKHMMEQMLENCAATCERQLTHNMSTMFNDSFEIKDEAVFCSTKLEFDSFTNSFIDTTLRRVHDATNTTLAGSIGAGRDRAMAPTDVAEFNIFIETPIEALSCIPVESAFYLLPNPLVTDPNESLSTLQLTPCTFLTSFGVIQELRKSLAWAKALAPHHSDCKFNQPLVTADIKELQQNARKQYERVTELLDQIAAVHTSTQCQLEKAEKYYTFIEENPLRHFIPRTKRFNEQTYVDYEAEFRTYHRLVSDVENYDLNE